jgi:hypothetical protein
MCGLQVSGSGMGPVAGSCEHGNEPSSSIKGGEILDYMRDDQLLMNSAARRQLVIGSLQL